MQRGEDRACTLGVYALFFGYTFPEIAEAVEMPEGTVKTKLYQTLKLLKSKLELQEV